MRYQFPFALLFLIPTFVHAGLKWDQTQLEFYPKPTDTEIHAEFNFANVGRDPITIEGAKTSCGCTTASLEKKTYLPGEKGHVSSSFNIGRRQGLQVKTISVSVQGEPQPYVLQMITHLQNAVEINPSFVSWTIGEPPEPKALAFDILPFSRLKLKKVSSSLPTMRTAVETLKDGSHYKIVLTPSDTSKTSVAVILIEAESESNVPMQFRAYARIAPASKK